MRIAQVLASDSWGDIAPSTIDKGLGGRETALIRLSEQWAKLGHEVTNFVPIQESERHYENEGYHEYVNLNLCKPMLSSFQYDAVVSWEMGVVFNDERIREMQEVRLVHMQVAHFLAGQMEATERYATGVVALSEWAAGFLVHSGLEMPEERIYVRPNGVNIDRFKSRFIERKMAYGHSGEMSMVYSSSPDRGLWNLLTLWPSIRHHWPEAELYVGYGVERYTDQGRWQHTRIGDMCVQIEHLMKQEGVHNMGSIGQKDLAELQSNSTFWCYPCDPIQPTETGCITAVENLAAGNPSIITDADCLEDEFGDVATVVELPIDQGHRYLQAINELWEDNDLYKERVRAGREFALERDWKVIAPTWLDLFEENRELTA